MKTCSSYCCYFVKMCHRVLWWHVDLQPYMWGHLVHLSQVLTILQQEQWVAKLSSVRISTHLDKVVAVLSVQWTTLANVREYVGFPWVGRFLQKDCSPFFNHCEASNKSVETHTIMLDIWPSTVFDTLKAALLATHVLALLDFTVLFKSKMVALASLSF